MPTVLSIWSILSLILVLLLSWAMLWAHVWRWTHGQKWGAMREWASNNHFRLRRAGGIAPEPLASLADPPPTVCIALVGARAMFLQIQTSPAADDTTVRWNVLMRQLEVDWPATALRPAAYPTSLLDFFRLEAFPAMMSWDRLSLHGIDAPAARLLAKSTIGALLPPDVGLILIGRRLVIDFSHRTFDGVELSRMLSLSEQLVAHLPSLTQ